MSRRVTRLLLARGNTIALSARACVCVCVCVCDLEALWRWAKVSVGEKTVGIQVCRAEVRWVVGSMHADIGLTAQWGVGRSLGP